MAFTPWWVVALIGFIVSYAFITHAGKAFLAGLIAVSLVWIITAVISDSGNQISVADTMSEVIGGVSSTIVILLTGLIGGIVCGLGAMTGVYARLILKPKVT